MSERESGGGGTYGGGGLVERSVWSALASSLTPISWMEINKPNTWSIKYRNPCVDEVQKKTGQLDRETYGQLDMETPGQLYTESPGQ